MKRMILAAVVAVGLAGLAAPRAEAGSFYMGISLGFHVNWDKGPGCCHPHDFGYPPPYVGQALDYYGHGYGHGYGDSYGYGH